MKTKYAHGHHYTVSSSPFFVSGIAAHKGTSGRYVGKHTGIVTAGDSPVFVGGRQYLDSSPVVIPPHQKAKIKMVRKGSPSLFSKIVVQHMGSTSIINLTPHAVNVNGKTFNPSGTVARVDTHSTHLDTKMGIDFYRTDFGAVQGLPDKQPDTFYIVSGLVASALPDRDDLLIPHDLIRDDQGRVIGCKGFRVNIS